MLPLPQTCEIEEAYTDEEMSECSAIAHFRSFAEDLEDLSDEESCLFGDYDRWSLDKYSENDSSCDDEAYAPVDKTTQTHTDSRQLVCSCSVSMKNEDNLYSIMVALERLVGSESWNFMNNDSTSFEYHL